MKETYGELKRLDSLGFTTWVTKANRLLENYNLDITQTATKFKVACKRSVHEKFVIQWTKELNNLEKNPILRTYILIKKNFGTEPYLSIVKNCKFRNAISQIRSSSHNLEIERGRHCKPIRPIEDRICNKCEIVEDEDHFLLACLNNVNERNALFEKISSVDPEFIHMSRKGKFIYMMTNGNRQIMTWVGKYIFNSFKLRNKLS